MIRSLGPGLAIPVLVALAWAAGTPVWAGTLEGTAAYRERIALPPDAVFEAVLEDVSRADAPAKVLGRARIDPAGQPPFRFQIAYDDAAVQPRRRYVVRATVRHQGRLLFTTDRAYPVLEGGAASPLSLLLVAAGGGRPPSPRTGSDADLPASYEGELPDASGGPVLWHLDVHTHDAHFARNARDEEWLADVGRRGSSSPRTRGSDTVRRSLPPLLSIIEALVAVGARP